MKKYWLFFTLFLLMQCNSKNNYHILFEKENPNKSFSIKIFYKDAIGFGPHMIKIYAKNYREKAVILLEDKIYNDGSNLQEANVSVNWMENSADIYIRGSEQETKKLTVTRFGKENYTIQTSLCEF